MIRPRELAIEWARIIQDKHADLVHDIGEDGASIFVQELATILLTINREEHIELVNHDSELWWECYRESMRKKKKGFQ